MASFSTCLVGKFSVLKVEGQTLSAIEAVKENNQLKNNLTQKETNQFLPFTVRNLMMKIEK